MESVVSMSTVKDLDYICSLGLPDLACLQSLVTSNSQLPWFGLGRYVVPGSLYPIDQFALPFWL